METNKLREIDIRNYWPAVVRDVDEFQQIANAENPEFNQLQSCIYRVLQDSFVNDATEYGVKRWESILNISPESGDTLDDRKARILAYLNIKLPYTTTVLRQMLAAALGEDNFTMKLNNDTATLTVSVALDTTESQIADVESLLERVLPRNLVTEMEWADGLPIEYQHVEYLEKLTAMPYIKTDLPFGTGIIKVRTSTPAPPEGADTKLYFSTGHYVTGVITASAGIGDEGKNFVTYQETPNILTLAVSGIGGNGGRQYCNNKAPNVATVIIDTENGYAEVNGCRHSFAPFERQSLIAPLPMFARQTWYSTTDVRNENSRANVRIHSMEIKAIANGNVRYGNFIPALDPTGSPCMFDTVTRKAFYNSGTGDFTYPGMETEAVSAGLDDTFYAKLTEHGVRRLYHVPKGYTGTMSEYAAANGFKELVEPPMPIDGYWMPEWRETETQLILDWVETEAPKEEGIENE